MVLILAPVFFLSQTLQMFADAQHDHMSIFLALILSISIFEGQLVQMTGLPRSELSTKQQKKTPNNNSRILSFTIHLLVILPGECPEQPGKQRLLLDALGIFFDLVELRIIDLQSTPD